MIADTSYKKSQYKFEGVVLDINKGTKLHEHI